MVKSESGSVGIIAGIFILCIVGSVSATYYVSGILKQDEIDDLKIKHETEIIQYETMNSNLSSHLSELLEMLSVYNQQYINKSSKD